MAFKGFITIILIWPIIQYYILNYNNCNTRSALKWKDVHVCLLELVEFIAIKYNHWKPQYSCHCLVLLYTYVVMCYILWKKTDVIVFLMSYDENYYFLL